MKIREKLFGTFIALMLLGASFTTQAATIWLTPDTQTVGAGDVVTLSIWSNFSDQQTIAGGFDVVYDDTILTNALFVFDDAFQPAITDPAFSRTCDDQPGVCNGIGIGSFSGIGGTGTPDYLMGQITFDVIGEGLASLSMRDNVSPAGSFIDYNTGAVMVIDYVGAEVAVVSPVPLPAAAWLMLSGLGALVGFCKRKPNVTV